MIVKEEVVKSVMMCEPISDRIMIMRLKMAPVNVLLVQIYAHCEDAKEEEKERSYERLDQVIGEYKKGRECLVVMGDFSEKVGDTREEDIVGPFGLGVKKEKKERRFNVRLTVMRRCNDVINDVRNDNGERVVNFSKRHNLFVTNTWFQQKRSAQHTWISPDKEAKNQIDYVLIDKRFRNGIQNSKSMSGADCESDYNPVLVTMKIRLQRVRKFKKAVKWNINIFRK